MTENRPPYVVTVQEEDNLWTLLSWVRRVAISLVLLIERMYPDKIKRTASDKYDWKE